MGHLGRTLEIHNYDIKSLWWQRFKIIFKIHFAEKNFDKTNLAQSQIFKKSKEIPYIMILRKPIKDIGKQFDKQFNQTLNSRSGI